MEAEYQHICIFLPTGPQKRSKGPSLSVIYNYDLTRYGRETRPLLTFTTEYIRRGNVSLFPLPFEERHMYDIGMYVRSTPYVLRMCSAGDYPNVILKPVGPKSPGKLCGEQAERRDSMKDMCFTE